MPFLISVFLTSPGQVHTFEQEGHEGRFQPVAKNATKIGYYEF